MTIPRLILVLFLLLLAMVIAALGYLQFANLNQYRDQIAGKISTLIGRDVTIGDVDVNLWPPFSITTNNVTIANASWGSQAHMAEIGHLTASIHPLSLISGPVLLRNFTLENVSLLVESDDEGKINWNLTRIPQKPKEQTEKNELPVMFETLQLNNITITRRQKGSPDLQLQLTNLAVAPDSSEQMKLAVTGKILDIPLELQGQLGTRHELEKGKSDFTLTGSLANMQLELNGHLAALTDQAETQLTVLASSDDTAKFIKAIGQSIPLSGPLKAKADITLNAAGQTVRLEGNLGGFSTAMTLKQQQKQLTVDGDLSGVDKLGTMLGITGLTSKKVTLKSTLNLLDHAVELQQLSAATGSSQITVSGTLATDGSNSSLQIKTKGDSLADILPSQPALPFNGTADLLLLPHVVKIDSLQLRLGASDLGGSVQVATGGNSTIKADLVAKILDLTEFTPDKDKEKSKQQKSGQQTPPSVPTKVLPFDQLQHLEMDIDLAAARFVSPAATLDKLKVLGSLHKGELKADVNFNTPGGGHSVNKTDLKASGQNTDLHLQLANLAVAPDSSEQMKLAVTGKILDIPLALQGQLGTHRELEKGKSVFTLTGSLANLQLELNGQLAFTDQAETHLKVLASSDDTAEFIQAIGQSIPLSGPLKAKADITLNAAGQTVRLEGNLGEFSTAMIIKLQQKQINFNGNLTGVDTLGTMLGINGLTSKKVTLKSTLNLLDHAVKLQQLSAATGSSLITVSGTLATDGGDTTLQIRAKGDSLADILPSQPALPFNGTADLLLSPHVVKIDPLQLRLGASDLAGSVHVATDSNSTIKANLVAKVLDLTELTPDKDKEKSSHQDTGQQTASLPVSKPESTSESSYVFSNKELPFDQLQRTEMDFDVSIDKFISSVITLSSFKTLGSLHKGELKADVNFVTPSGGRSVNKIDLKAAGQDSKLQASFEARDLHMKVISGEIESAKNNPAINISADLQSTGNSPRALAANSNGNILVTAGPGVMNNTLLNNMSGDIIQQLLTALNPFSKKETKAHLECGVLDFNIVNGLSTIDTLLFQDKNVTVVAGGNIDLKSEKLNLEFNTKPRTGVGVSADMFITPFVALRGTLENPSIGLNKSGTLLTLGAAYFTGGLSLAVTEGMDRLSGQADQCNDALRKHPLPALADE